MRFSSFKFRVSSFPRLISRLFRQRQLGDYEFELSIRKDEAVEDLNYADRIVQAIESYLIRKGFIDPSNKTSASNS